MLKDINKIAGGLSAIYRYSQTRLANPESVLEHTGYVCMAVLLICNELEKQGEEINTEMALKKAILHDIEESITGDIASPMKYWNISIREEIAKIEKEAASSILEKMDNSGRLIATWEVSKAGKSGFIVAVADKLAVVYKIEQEVLLYGNNTLIDHCDNTIDALNKLINYQSVNETISKENEHIIINLLKEGIETCQKIQKRESI